MKRLLNDSANLLHRPVESAGVLPKSTWTTFLSILSPSLPFAQLSWTTKATTETTEANEIRFCQRSSPKLNFQSSGSKPQDLMMERKFLVKFSKQRLKNSQHQYESKPELYLGTARTVRMGKASGLEIVPSEGSGSLLSYMAGRLTGSIRPIAVVGPFGAVMVFSRKPLFPYSWKVLGISQQQSFKRLSTELGEFQTT